MAEGAPGEPADFAAAIRYTLAVLDEQDRQADGGAPEDAPDLTVTAEEAGALAPALAFLVISARRAMAAQLGAGSPGAQSAAVRAALGYELEIAEMSAALDGIEAGLVDGS